MCCIVFSVDMPELAEDVMETKVFFLSVFSLLKIKLVEEIAESSSRLGEQSVHYMITMQNLSTVEEKDAFINKVISFCSSHRDALLLAGCHFCKLQSSTKRAESLSILVKA